eukprot:gene47102-63080_t
MGTVSANAGRMAAECVVWATQAALGGQIGALVTAPLHKEALALAGAPHHGYPGHTEMLQALAAAHGQKTVVAMPVRMMLANEELRVVLVSIHLSLRQALDAVTFDQVLQTLQITHHSLQAMLGRAPRIAVAGLNPHAGDGGSIGMEEIEIIAPAIDGLKKEWNEAAATLGASPWQFWRYIGMPILWPNLLGTISLLFANAFGAIATAYALTGSSLNIVPIVLYAQIRGDVLNNPGLGAALALGMIVITAVTNVIYLHAKLWSWIIFGLGAAYFLVPLLATVQFSLSIRRDTLSLDAYTNVLQ